MKTIVGQHRLYDVAASDTRYLSIAGESVGTTTEDEHMSKIQDSGTLSTLSVYIYSNATTASSTIISRVNGADGNQTVTIPSGTTGSFVDTSNSDSVTAGDTYNYKVVAGSGGTLGTRETSSIFESSSYTTTTLLNGATSSLDISSASATLYVTACGYGSNYSTDAVFERAYIATGGTLRRMNTGIVSNARSTSTVLTIRINGADGNQTFTIPASTTGYFTDTSNIDTVSAGDFINVKFVTGAGTETISRRSWSMALTHTVEKWSSQNPQTYRLTGAVATRYPSLFSNTNSTITNYTTFYPNINYVIKEMYIYCDSNTLDVDATLDLFINGSSVEALTLTSSTTGLFSVTGLSHSLTSSDSVSFKLAKTGGTGNATYSNPVLVFENPLTGFAYSFAIII